MTFVCADCGYEIKEVTLARARCPDCNSTRIATEQFIIQYAGEDWRVTCFPDRYSSTEPNDELQND